MLLRPSLVLLTSVLLAAPAPSQARSPEHHALGADGLALQGHDPVAYFDEGGAAPRPGRPELALEHDGVTYRFVSEAHREAFRADPARYEPAHGGWCSYAMSLGKQVAIDPAAFRVTEGRLMLFYSTDYTAVDSDWVEGEARHIAAADAEWKRLSGEDPRRAPDGSWRPYREFNLSGQSLAIQGYDPVAYFPEGGGEPQKGSQKYELRHRGVLYRFASAANRDTFRKDPAKYEPQHGGWCSYAMGASGERVEVDPEAFRLTDGQLHLFFNGWFADTRDDWDEDTANLKKKADGSWSKQLAAAPRSDRQDGRS